MYTCTNTQLNATNAEPSQDSPLGKEKLKEIYTLSNMEEAARTHDVTL